MGGEGIKIKSLGDNVAPTDVMLMVDQVLGWLFYLNIEQYQMVR